MSVIYSDQAITRLPAPLGDLFKASIEWDEEIRALPAAEHQPALELRIGLHDIVIAFFPESNGNIGCHFIKGARTAGRVVLLGSAEECSWAGIICRELAEADAMRLVLGDGKREPAQ